MGNLFLKPDEFEEIFNSHIKIETYSKSIDSLFFNKRERDRIDYKPYYQRNYVWDDTKATYFVESILLGTEIPPLIFFNEGKRTEVIDGRQRFETIKRFIDGEFSLSKVGLNALSDLSKKNLDSLRKDFPVIYNAFTDAKVRIIGFELVNHPPSDPILIDKIKKEIFSRYNSGITPLRRAEIDNAVYDSDDISRHFKANLKSRPGHLSDISNLFLRQYKTGNPANIETALQFIRKALVLYKFPIKHYASGKSRTELIKNFYEYYYSDSEEPSSVFSAFFSKIEVIKLLESHLRANHVHPNRLFFECILWAINIMEEEGADYKKLSDPEVLASITDLIKRREAVFDLTDSHYAKETIERYSTIGHFIELTFGVNLTPYLQGNKNSADRISEIKKNQTGYKEELEKLESLRITKPDPSRNTIDDLTRAMKRSRFLVRPSYQRSEVINLAKASSIIESILLGIMLPAIFIYKRTDGVSEVIDGQQRLLTILGFIGESYIDENGSACFSRNNFFKLKSPKILKNLNGSKFSELVEEFRDKILDFDLFIVEIEERLNPQFNPVDLFIRLNDKPFPIRENSFEMWNSWADKNVIDSIKDAFSDYEEWFYLKNVRKSKFRDRMSNEELYTTLAFFDYRKRHDRPLEAYLDIHQKGDRINARIKQKKEITSLLIEATEFSETKEKFLQSIANVSDFIQNVEFLLGNKMADPKEAIDKLMSAGSKRKYYQRTLQDFYILWWMLSDVKVNSTNRVYLYELIEKTFQYMKNIPPQHTEGNRGYVEFTKLVSRVQAVANADAAELS